MLKLLTAVLLLIVAINTKGSYVYIKDEIKNPTQEKSISADIKPFEIFKNSLDFSPKFPDTSAAERKNENEKVSAYNESSGKVIQANENAVQNSPALTPCDNNPNCTAVTQTPSPIPTQTPTHTPTPSPMVTIVDPIPYPISITPPKCEQLCPMIACLDNESVQQMSRPEVVIEDCKCPCVPPPIY